MPFFRKFLSAEKRQTVVKNRRLHLANERTFLAWIRTSLGIMAFGIVVEKVLIPLGCLKNNQTPLKRPLPGMALYLGVFLVIIGALTGLLATYRFIKTEKDIMEGVYRPSIVSDSLIAIVVVVIGILLALYLVFPSAG